MIPTECVKMRLWGTSCSCDFDNVPQYLVIFYIICSGGPIFGTAFLCNMHKNMNKSSLMFSRKTLCVALAKKQKGVYTLRVEKSGEEFIKVERKTTTKPKKRIHRIFAS